MLKFSVELMSGSFANQPSLQGPEKKRKKGKEEKMHHLWRGTCLTKTETPTL
jgi:hypothetical protein